MKLAVVPSHGVSRGKHKALFLAGEREGREIIHQNLYIKPIHANIKEEFKYKSPPQKKRCNQNTTDSFKKWINEVERIMQDYMYMNACVHIIQLLSFLPVIAY